MSTEIKCPKCGTIFTVDENEYATLLEQVRTKEFDASVEKETDRIMRDMKKDAELAAMKAAAENAKIVAERDTCIAELKAKLEHESENLTYKIEKAVAEKEKEIYERKRSSTNYRCAHIRLLMRSRTKAISAPSINILRS